jgi:hypothetical protein
MEIFLHPFVLKYIVYGILPILRQPLFQDGIQIHKFKLEKEISIIQSSNMKM